MILGLLRRSVDIGVLLLLCCADGGADDGAVMQDIPETVLDADSFAEAVDQGHYDGTPAADVADEAPKEKNTMSFNGGGHVLGAASVVLEDAENVDEAARGHSLLDEAVFSSLQKSLKKEQLDEMIAGVFAHNRAVLPNLQAAFKDEAKGYVENGLKSDDPYFADWAKQLQAKLK